MNLQTFTSLEGRIPRKGFWLGLLVLMIITWILEFILFAVFGVSMMSGMDPNATPEAAAAAASEAMGKMALPLGILMLLVLWPSICLYAKRWHDRDKSGWWSLIMFVPIIGGIWMLVELGFLRGTDGPNRFGNDPIAG
jgi:uncharacterized membrane protein YhaH (DUF805 family)